MLLSGKTALVTGGNQGIGWGIARLFAEHGARVAVGYPTDATAPARLEAALGADAIALRCDVSSVSEIRAHFAEVLSALGTLDILVNNAGIFPRAHVLELDEQTWDSVLDVNLKGMFFCCQEAGRLMA